ncbi:MAG TPA: hypothetical protein VNA18_02980 [Nitrososphaeraceae archaeon]|nr:hypothetical protein [Nitrososphaeraceae archaeon]
MHELICTLQIWGGAENRVSFSSGGIPIRTSTFRTGLWFNFTSKAGLVNQLFEKRPELLLVDELEKNERSGPGGFVTPHGNRDNF